MELKKSYNGLILLTLVFVAVIIGVCFIPEKYMNVRVITRIINLATVWWIALLTFVVYKK